MIRNKNCGFELDNGFAIPAFTAAQLAAMSASLYNSYDKTKGYSETKLAYDLTNNVPKYNDGTGWQAFGSGGTSHAFLSATHTDSTAGAVARGAIVTGQGSSPTWTKLAFPGTPTGKYLTATSTDVAWSTYALALGGTVTTAGALTTVGAYGITLRASNTTDITLPTTGTVAVNPLTTQYDLFIAGAAGAEGRFPVGTSAQVLMCNATPAPTWTTIGGNATISATGSVSVTNLTIASEAQGDLIYRGASVWQRLAPDAGKYLRSNGAGAAPTWETIVTATASGLTSPFTVDGGTFDPVTTVTTQTSSAAALTIPDLAGVAQEWVYSKKAQTLEGKTLTSVKVVTTDGIFDAGGDAYLKFVEATTPKTYVLITSGDTTVNPIISGAGETNTGLTLKGAGTGNVTIADGTDATKLVDFDLTGEATGKKTTLAFSAATSNKVITFPNATDTVVCKDTADTFTNKTLTDTTCIFGANGALTKTLGFDLSGMTAANKVTLAFTGTVATVTFPAATDTLVGKATIDTFTNKTLTDATCIFGADGALTKTLGWSLGGITAGKKITLTAGVTTENTAITLPATADMTGDAATLIGRNTVDTLTNKTIDCDGTGNVITNVNGNELDPITVATGAYAVPFLVTVVNAGAATVTVFDAGGTAVPFKCRVIDAWAVSTKAGGCNGNWKLVSDAGDITTTVSYGVDTAVTRASTIDDAKHVVTTDLDLVNSDAADTSIVYIWAIRVD